MKHAVMLPRVEEGILLVHTAPDLLSLFRPTINLNPKGIKER